MNGLTQITVAITLGMASAGMALADEAVQPSRARTDVGAELVAARASGELAALVSEDSGSAWLSRQASASKLTRSDVIAEMEAARRRGELAALVSEDSGSSWLSRMASGSQTTRAEVIAEVLAARRSGELAATHGQDDSSAYVERVAARDIGQRSVWHAGPDLGTDPTAQEHFARAGSMR
jgi:hypothetical protein